LIGVAAVLAGIFLFDSLGSWAAVGLVGVGIAAFARYHWLQTRKRAARCLNCGEAAANLWRELRGEVSVRH
jgi:hypothetical protein